MKKLLLAVFLITAIGLTACKKEPKEDQVPADGEVSQTTGLGTRYAALSISIRESADLNSKASAYLKKIEDVELLEETQGTYKGKEITILKVKTVDGKEGYQDAQYFGIKAIVINSDGVAVYSKPSATSSIINNLEYGTVAVVLEQMGEWYKIVAYNLADKEKEIWQKWIKADSGYSDDMSFVIEASKIEKVKFDLYRIAKDSPDKDASLKKQSLPELKSLVKSNSDYIAGEAQKLIDYIEGNETSDEGESDEYAEDGEEEEMEGDA
ncbi:MAG: lipoprotein LenA [Spirochaetes bacterium]|nr:lipoprotein LenA [Spirochaetota bacterium]